jgi:hypothetical protein
MRPEAAPERPGRTPGRRQPGTAGPARSPTPAARRRPARPARPTDAADDTVQGASAAPPLTAFSTPATAVPAAPPPPARPAGSGPEPPSGAGPGPADDHPQRRRATRARCSARMPCAAGSGPARPARNAAASTGRTPAGAAPPEAAPVEASPTGARPTGASPIGARPIGAGRSGSGATPSGRLRPPSARLRPRSARLDPARPGTGGGADRQSATGTYGWIPCGHNAGRTGGPGAPVEDLWITRCPVDSHPEARRSAMCRAPVHGRSQPRVTSRTRPRSAGRCPASRALRRSRP